MTETLPQPITPLSPAQQTSLINLIRRAAKTEILPRFRNLSAAQVNTKSGPHDLVTEADTAAEAMIARGILRMFPTAMVLGEEAAAENPALRAKAAKAELAFIIDPVDGTWNFAHGLPLFGVILAATRFGRPVFGLLYDAIMDDWIVADDATPTTIAGANSAPRPLSVSAGGALADISGYIHLYLLPKDKQAAMAATLPDFARTMMLRCSCHEYRTIAQGGAEFCLSGILNPWDHAAGVLICQKAGGFVQMLDGRPYETSITEGYLLAAPDQETWEKLRDRFAFLTEPN
ncbi:inositol monophosphatase family protein [Thalassovita taeanensis]|uniref:Fructose-1,6-bisphosphatase n=1 Tax=Thalassovita taeanensis TaxID=657014 RepID=A0A1H9AP10_9RHOB|nr:inositol monophosphatase [Thalassovita taeanensis]SEP78103.1 fructose-1,6-bisphosphatase [Thalassovita taeanensis]